MHLKSWVFVYDNNECTQYGVHFKFLNKFGGYDYVFCKGHTATDVNYTRQEYNTSTANYHTTTGLSDNRLQIVDPNKRQVVSQVTQQKPSHKAYTGYLSKRFRKRGVYGNVPQPKSICHSFCCPAN